MDAWLAQVYGTNGGSSEDLEKIAQAEMAQQMAAQEGIDLSQLSPEQIQQLGAEVLGGQGPQGGEQEQGGEITEEIFQQAQQILANPEQFDPSLVQEAQAVMQHVEQLQAEQGGAPQGEQQLEAPAAQGAPQQEAPAQPTAGTAEMAKIAEAQAKFEEADFLGRVMAHSFNQESEKIAAAKEAGVHGPFKGIAHSAPVENAKHYAGRALHGLKDIASGKQAREGYHAMHAAHQGAEQAKHLGQHATSGKMQHAFGQHAAKRMGEAAEHKGHMLRGAAKTVGLYGGGAAAAAGAHHAMSKEATITAIEKAAMAQAAAILEANGIDPATGAPVQQQQVEQPAPAPAAQQALGELVEKRAHQILRSLGYSIE